MKKFNINVSTGLDGMDGDFSAYADSESELTQVARDLAYNNFKMYGGVDLILKNTFEPDENGNYSYDDIREANDLESEYYGFYIEEIRLGDDREEYFYDNDLVYDGRLKKLSLTNQEKVKIYNTFLINFHTSVWTGHDLQPYFDKMGAYSYARTNSVEGQSSDESEIKELTTLRNLIN